jgi:hypothetical protein
MPIYVLSASTKHADIPHILFDYHAEGGSKKLEKLDSKAVLSIRNYSLFSGSSLLKKFRSHQWLKLENK